MKVLLIGYPGCPIFEVGNRISEWKEIDFFTIERYEPNIKDEYFLDKIPEVTFDVGDFTSGSGSQHMSRMPASKCLEKMLDMEMLPDANDALSDEEIMEIVGIENGIVSTEIADEKLIDWADYVIGLTIEPETAIKWFTDRRKCRTCGSVYHKQDRPSMISGICDRCGSELKRKPEDDPNLVRKQYKEWKSIFWKIEERGKEAGKYKEIKIDKMKSMEDISRIVDKIIDEKIGILRDPWTYNS